MCRHAFKDNPLSYACLKVRCILKVNWLGLRFDQLLDVAPTMPSMHICPRQNSEPTKQHLRCLLHGTRMLWQYSMAPYNYHLMDTNSDNSSRHDRQFNDGYRLASHSCFLSGVGRRQGCAFRVHYHGCKANSSSYRICASAAEANRFTIFVLSDPSFILLWLFPVVVSMT
jgi:hypothetical protein